MSRALHAAALTGTYSGMLRIYNTAVELSTRRHYVEVLLVGVTGVSLSLSVTCARCVVNAVYSYPIDHRRACVDDSSEVAQGSGFFLCSASTGTTSLSPAHRYLLLLHATDAVCIHAYIMLSSHHHLSLCPPCLLPSCCCSTHT